MTYTCPRCKKIYDGYFTRFTLKIESEFDLNRVAIIDEIRALYEDAGIAFYSDGSNDEPAKWYDHKTDVAIFSKKYPQCVFKLSGAGEDGVMWERSFRNGKSNLLQTTKRDTVCWECTNKK
jgi:hypothetical protein